MSDEVLGVVVAHAELAEALIDCVAKIAGTSDALTAVSNEGLAPAELVARVQEAVGSGPAIIFADLASGSCALAGRRIAADSPRIGVVTGVSLPMLLDFVFHRDMELGALVERLVEKARAGTTAELASAPAAGERPAADSSAASRGTGEAASPAERPGTPARGRTGD